MAAPRAVEPSYGGNVMIHTQCMCEQMFLYLFSLPRSVWSELNVTKCPLCWRNMLWKVHAATLTRLCVRMFLGLWFTFWSHIGTFDDHTGAHVVSRASSSVDANNILGDLYAAALDVDGFGLYVSLFIRSLGNDWSHSKKHNIYCIWCEKYVHKKDELTRFNSQTRISTGKKCENQR